MIELTRLDGEIVYVNPDLLQYLEARPDTRIILTTGAMLIVREDPQQVIQRVIVYRRAVFTEQRSPAASFRLLRHSEDA